METDTKRRFIVPMVWDTHTALATIVVGSVITIALLRGSLKTAIQP